MALSLLISVFVIGFMFSVGCCCCACTSCTQADDEAAVYEVVVTGVANGSCATGCTNADGTYNVTHQITGTCHTSGSVTNYGCCYTEEVDLGAPYLNYSACTPQCLFPPQFVKVYMAISSNQSETGYGNCTQTLTTVDVTGELGAGCLDTDCDLAHFEDLSGSILDCSLASYDSRDIPFIGSIAGSACNWSGATCTVTRL